MGVTICKKSPSKAAVAITTAKRQEVAVLCQAVLAVTDFASLFGGHQRVLFLSKKGVKRYRRRKDC
jgi:hypothetical protein